MADIEENKENEQYFFSEQTHNWLLTILKDLKNVALVSCPTLSMDPELNGRKDIIFLDIDTRFPKITYFDINDPEYKGNFDAVIFDPPFFNVKIKDMLRSVDLLLNFDYSKKVLITYLARREKTFLRIFAKYGLKPIKEAKYQTVKKIEKNKIMFYTNFELNNYTEIEKKRNILSRRK